MIEYSLEAPEDAAAIERLLDAAFGPDRHRKRSYDFRRGVAPLRQLCLVARSDGELVACARAWPLRLSGHSSPLVLLGPVAVDSAVRGQGIGSGIVRCSLARAQAGGCPAAVLVGDEAYYGRFGFVPAARFGIEMTRENPARVLVLPLAPGKSLPCGALSPWRAVRLLTRAA